MPRVFSPLRIGLVAVLCLLHNSTGAAAAEHRQIQTPDGLLIVEIEDAQTKAVVEGNELRITGVGPRETRLAFGPHLFPRGADAEAVPVLTVRDGDRVVVRVLAAAQKPRSGVLPREAPSGPARVAMLNDVQNLAAELSNMRVAMEDVLWRIYGPGQTTFEAAKLLVGFFRGDGDLQAFPGTPEEQRELTTGLSRLRARRKLAMKYTAELARQDAAQPAAPLVGAWKITAVRGMGGIAADALELYDPDPVGRTFAAANDVAALNTGAGFWLFEATYGLAGDGTVDLRHVIHRERLYRGRFQAHGDRATIRVNPMNTARPDEADGNPNNGGFVLELERE